MRRAMLSLVVLALAGCATIPTTGPVLVGGPITVDHNAEVDYLPAGPAEGATQREILDGFLAAGAAPQNNFRIARTFLTDETALNWNPAKETVVRGIYATVSTISGSQLAYSTSVVSRVDESGVFSPSTSNQTTSWEFGFTEVGGEWRLNSVPDVTLITEAAFASAYDEFTIYFHNRDRTAFIPDVRVFARQSDTVTAVARAVISGPSEFLPNAVSSFPDDAVLATAPVTVTSGRAVVDVNDVVQQASLTDQQHMLSQLGVSLSQLPDVTSTSLSVNGNPLTVSAIPGVEFNPRVDDRPLVAYDGVVGFAENGAVAGLGALGERIANLNPTSVSFDLSTNSAVVGTRVGVYLVGARTERIADRASVVDPQIDGSRAAWWVAPANPSRVSVFAGGQTFTVKGPWASSAVVSGVEVSREDSRVAIAVNERGRASLYVGAIMTDESGRPVSVEGFRRLSLAADSLIDLAWSDSTHIAVLATKNQVVHAELVTVGGGSTLLGQPQNPIRISGGNTGAAGLTVLAQNGQLWRPRGSGWQSTGIPADLLATQR